MCIYCIYYLQAKYGCKNMQALLGTDQELARWRSCVNFVNQNMGVAVGRMYVERYFSGDSRENVSTQKNGILTELNI